MHVVERFCFHPTEIDAIEKKKEREGDRKKTHPVNRKEKKLKFKQSLKYNLEEGKFLVHTKGLSTNHQGCITALDARGIYFSGLPCNTLLSQNKTFLFIKQVQNS